MTDERWRAVPGFEGRYEASDRGQVRNTRTGYVLKQYIGAQGYYRVGVGHSRATHVLVLRAFAGPRPEGMYSRHLDGNPLNNHLSNLKWGTPTENAADRTAHGRTAQGARHPSRATKLTTADVDDIRRRGQAGQTPTEIAPVYSISRVHASCILRGVKWGWHVTEEART